MVDERVTRVSEAFRNFKAPDMSAAVQNLKDALAKVGEALEGDFGRRS